VCSSDLHTWRFAESDDQWRHSQLGEIVRELGRLKGQIANAERSVHGPEAVAAWSAAIEAIAASDKYRGVKWPSGDRLVPQLGLVPIGPDPVSGLWEFSHLDSGDVATRAADGTIELKPGMGLVFVLLPGGRVPVEFVPPGRNLDQELSLTKVDLDPFFLSKYEMTNEQWNRLGGWRTPGDPVEDPLNPASNCAWTDCVATLSRSVAWLWLPTEAQWEYGCRAGTTTRWWTGVIDSTLRGVANVNFGPDPAVVPPFQRIGQLRANPFGIHDVYGNVWEWCRDALGSDESLRQPGDGFLDEPDAFTRMIRGGYKGTSAWEARSSLRLPLRSDGRGNDIGLRPARGITR
jgi:formylglycine-generating enzyme required for sulfatase activity